MTPHAHRIRRALSLVLCALIVALAGPTIPASSPQDVEATIGGLSLAVERVEDIRAVKKLQISYAQYLQFGLWSQAALLFADNAEAI